MNAKTIAKIQKHETEAIELGEIAAANNGAHAHLWKDAGIAYSKAAAAARAAGDLRRASELESEAGSAHNVMAEHFDKIWTSTRGFDPASRATKDRAWSLMRAASKRCSAAWSRCEADNCEEEAIEYERAR